MFRVTPVDAAVDEMLEAFALALERMPALKEAEVYTLMSWYPGDDAMEGYFEDCRQPLKEENDTCCGSRVRRSTRGCHWWEVKYVGRDFEKGTERRLEWKVEDWRPSEKVLDMIHRAVAGGDGKGGELVEQWLNVSGLATVSV